jgi:hypothetical protein
MSIKSAILTAIAFMLLLPLHAFGHQQQEAYTSILFNLRTGQLEVQHRFYLHDAEHAAKRVIDKNSDLIQDPVSREAFAYYATATFALRDQDEQALPLSYVGAEADGKYLWVYQETPLTDKMNALGVKMSSLQDIWPSQINHINIEYLNSEHSKQVRSLRLSDNQAKEWQTLVLTGKDISPSSN